MTPSAAGSGRWRVALVGTALLVVVTHLVALGTSPPGLYQDEASIGYDAWAVAHHGHDQHGTLLPLFFQSFDDYKSPIYHYLLAPFTLVLPLSAATIRLPAAICSIIMSAVWALTARRATGSPAVTVVTLGAAAFTPWLFVEGRLGFEVVTLALLLSVGLWCLVHAESGDGARWFGGAGAAIGACVFAYPSGRVDAGLVTAAVVVAHVVVRGKRGWWWALAGPVVAYALLGLWSLGHPGALTARLDAVSITHGNPGVIVVAGRFGLNYLRHWDPRFLLLGGDGNRRHATGVLGMLLLATVPAMVAGVVTWWRDRRTSALSVVGLLGLAAAAVPAAATDEGIPHALRATPMVPFLLLALVEGWPVVLDWVAGRRRARAALVALAVVQVAVFLVDYYGAYPNRVQRLFDVGEDAAILAAHNAAPDHALLLDAAFGQPYVHALATLRPPPGASLDATLAEIHARTLPVSQLATVGHAGDVAVLTPEDAAPPGATLIDTETGPDGNGGTQVLARVYRLGG